MMYHAGIGTYIRNLVPRIIGEKTNWKFTLLVPSRSGQQPSWMRRDAVRVVECRSDIYTVREQIEIPWRSPADADLLWSPHYNVPLLSRSPLVVTVHDVIHLALPDMYGGGLRLFYARHMLNTVRQRARAVIFDSTFTRNEFELRVGRPERFTTIHLGVDESWSNPISDTRPAPRPYLLFVGSVKPHKNLVALLNAFQSLAPTIAHDLIIIGKHRDQRTNDDTAIQLASRMGERVRLLADVDDATLKRYVAHATALVFPSLYEGFGLPALEAMAAGCPCIVSQTGSLPEVCQSAALYCDPRNPADIADQIQRLISDDTLRARLVDAGLAHAARFRWDRCAAETAKVLERALENRPG